MNDWPLTLFLFTVFIVSGVFAMMIGAFFHWVCKAVFRDDHRMDDKE